MIGRANGYERLNSEARREGLDTLRLSLIADRTSGRCGEM